MGLDDDFGMFWDLSIVNSLPRDYSANFSIANVQYIKKKVAKYNVSAFTSVEILANLCSDI